MLVFLTWISIFLSLVDANVTHSRCKTFSECHAHALSAIEVFKATNELK